MRASKRWIACVLVVFVIILGLRWHRPNINSHEWASFRSWMDHSNQTTSKSHGKAANATDFHPRLREFWTQLSPILLQEAKPPLADLPETGPGTGIEALINGFSTLPKGYDSRQSLINLSEEDVTKLKTAHATFVEKTSALTITLPFNKGTKGIVVTAAGIFVPIFVVSLRMLRRTGSDLPVEVFFETRDTYEKEACEDIFPGLNARCLVLSDVLGADFRPEKYQLKSFALLMSTFDDVMLLDADNIPMEKPEDVLSSERYQADGMVTWPDYWANTASPLYYTISSQEPPPLSLRAASESGQYLISKSKHAGVLLLTVYYNTYGPGFYYPLLSQGAVGQGDKETFLAAAGALNASVYAVHTPPRTIMYTTIDGKDRKSSGTLQANADDDYEIHQPDPPAKTKRVFFTSSSSSKKTIENERMSFLHSQMYKLDPATFVNSWRNEINTRIWGPAADMEALFQGRDVEKEVWSEILFVACTYEGRFESWRKNETGKNACNFAKMSFTELFDTQ